VACEVFMPKMSDHMEMGEILQWLVGEGDEVNEGQVILEVMTDKVAAELTAEASGVLKGIREGADEGAIIPVGETIAFIAGPGEEVPTLPPLVSAAADEAREAPGAHLPSETLPEEVQAGRIRAVPAARRLARELQVDLAEVRGTGPGGRIREADVQALAQERRSAKASEQTQGVRATPVARRVAREIGVDITQVKGTGPGGRIREEDVRAFAQSSEPPALSVGKDVEWLDLTSVQRLSGERMVQSVQQAPQFDLSADVDVTQTLWLRDALMERVMAETGERLSITAILVKIVADALENHPRANASYVAGRVMLHHQINVGVAVGSDSGLVVPVIKAANTKSVTQVVQELELYKEKAREMRFSSEDLSDGTFTISNLGMYGIDRFAAIINPPQSAILAVGRAIKRPVGLANDTIALRSMMNLTLTVDHRCMDGVQGARFLAKVVGGLQKPFFLL
jgi:pyruvate dehydrogenase E2 component (dihydrolipoamide acetyltransferase)